MHEQEEFITRSEVQEMIDAAIRRHNRNASIISMCIGWVVLALLVIIILCKKLKETTRHVELEKSI